MSFRYILTLLWLLYFSNTVLWAQETDTLASYSNAELISKAQNLHNNLYLNYLEKRKLEPEELATVYQLQANYLISEGDMEKSKFYFLKLDSTAALLKDPLQQFIAKLSLGEIYFRQKNYPASRAAFESGKPLIDQLPDGIEKKLSKAEFSYFYYLNGKFDVYAKELEEIKAELIKQRNSRSLKPEDKEYLEMAIATISVFMTKGYLMNESFDKAEAELKFSTSLLAEHFPGVSSITTVHQRLLQGEFYFFKKEFKMAIPYFQEILEMQDSEHYKDYQYMARTMLAIAYYQLGDFRQALALAEINVKDPVPLADYIDFEMESLRYAYLASKELGLTERALDYSKMFLEQDEALNDTKRSNFVNSILNNIQVSSLEADLKAKTKTNYVLRYSLIGLAVLILGLIVFTIYQLKENKRNRMKIQEFMKRREDEESRHQLEKEKRQLAAKEVEHVSSEPASPDDRTVKILEKLEEFEEGELFTDSKMSLAFLASHLGTNTISLSKIINTHKEMNFNDYINGLRVRFIIDKIKKEPKFEQYKISYLAEVSGFSSHSIFSKAFKKSTGVTPSQFLDYLKEEHE